MCGIVGFFGPGELADLEKLTNLLAHRGPDGEGYFVDRERGIFLGHRRLAIRDIAGGTQPMRSADGRFVIVYNGELYNDGDLRARLVALGHCFDTKSDTEVLLYALVEWGLECLTDLDGQFAFCFVDKETGESIIARDRFGEKPLFWSTQGNRILFASESNVLGHHPWVKPEIDEESCIRYLLLGYLPPPYSIIKGIQQVRPGHAICFNIGNLERVREVLFARPWDPWPPDFTNVESQRQFGIDVIENAVTSRRVSDVPAGVLLSGGVDSSLVVACAVRSGWRPPTFTIGFATESFDESGDANQLAHQLGLENIVRRLDSWDDNRLLTILQSLDEPLGDPSYIPTYEVFESAASRAKVLLTGDGGDELFFGYEPFRVLNLSERLRELLPNTLIKVMLGVVRRLPRSATYMNKVDVTERFIDGLRYSPIVRLLVWMCTLRSYEWGRFFLVRPNVDSVFGEESAADPGRDNLDSARRLFLGVYLPGSIFSKSDTSAMANGVEARTIFLHPEIVSFALSRRGREELSREFGKRTLRHLARSLGLEAVASRRKHGFALPIADFLRNTSLPAPVIHASMINQDAVNQAWSAARSGSVRHASFLWAALALVNSRAYRVATSRSDESRTMSPTQDV